MKTIVVHVLTIIFNVALAAPDCDWKAIQTKYTEIHEKWHENLEKALTTLKTETDEENFLSARILVYDVFHPKEEAFLEAHVYKGIDDKNLTPEKVEEFDGKISEITKTFKEDFKPFQNKLKPESQKKIDELWEECKAYRDKKTKEVIELLKS